MWVALWLAHAGMQRRLSSTYNNAVKYHAGMRECHRQRQLDSKFDVQNHLNANSPITDHPE